VSEPKPKSFEISRWVVWEAYRRVRANRGAAGVDEQSIEEFERDLKGNLYKLWNRLSSGSYFPPPVRAVEIPKRDGSSRMLGVPTVADRIAQTVVAGCLEPGVEPFFHPDSYGYRPGRSALDAVGVCRERCWRSAWVLDLDLKSFFDSVPHDLVLKAVARHTDQRWVLLYVERWLKAPLQREDGSLVARDRGTPQGSAISPLLANMFLHYAFDAWMAKQYPAVRFERYCDDVIVHASSEQQARRLRAAIASRLTECGLQLNERKTRIVYCKSSVRRGSHEHVSFDFLGYTFRPRLSRNKAGDEFVGFLPAVSDDARKRLGREIRRWRLHRWSGKTLTALARSINVIVQGWINYYGRFYRSELIRLLRRLNQYLVRWARWKYKRLRRYPDKARRFLAAVFRREPGLFAHWRFGARPDGWTMGAG
jgi:RNA-directed DNA polymerase